MNKNPTIYGLRHGETPDNAQGVIRSHNAVKLSERGKMQMRRAANRLKGKGITCIYCSDIARAQQAAKIVADIIDSEIEVRKDLRTRNMGTLTGAKVEAMRPLLDWYSAHPDKAPPQGESANEWVKKFQKYMIEQVAETKNDPDNEKILIIFHGRHFNVLNRLLAAKVSGKIDTMNIPVNTDPPGTLVRLDVGPKTLSRTTLIRGEETGVSTS